MTDDLLAFIRACLDDDERVTRAAYAGPWLAHPAYAEVSANGGVTVADVFALEDVRDTTEHIARWDPARVLAEIDAKRRIIDRYERLLNSRIASSASGARLSVLANEYDLRILPLLAMPYAERPGYRDEWRPTA